MTYISNTFPTAIQTGTDPIGTDGMSTFDHAGLESFQNDSILALKNKVGVDSSAVNTSHDYKLSGVSTGDKAVSKTGTETLTNKTISSPQINFGSDANGDIIIRNGSGVTSRLAVGTSGQILNVDAGTGLPAWVSNPSAADASTTVKGVVEEATQAEVDAGTATGGTGARLFVNPSTLGSILGGNFGDGSDGNVTIASGTTTLTRDMLYNNLTIQTGGILDTNGFRVFVKGTLTYEGSGKIINNGGNGGAGGAATVGTSVGTGGTAGTAASTGASLPDSLPGFSGGDGGSGGGGNGVVGTNGTAVAKSLGVVGSAAGAGSTGGTSTAGSGPGTGGAAGTAGAQTGTVFNKPNSILGGYYLMDNQPTISTLGGSTGSGSGGGGGGGRSINTFDCGAGGGGGGSGAPGGIVWIAAKSIITVNSNVYAQATGGNGGNGGAGGNSTGHNGGGGSGGGGGAGGSGGVVIIFYHSLTGSGSIDVAGGSAGTGGAAGTANGSGTNGTAGANGTAGLTGQTYLITV